ncbi:EutN/CcmL family microcompartment protein [candidate division CSSED10-310 bacterium]|uniref:EutN/CcmL family microcompartment protein n=1 Tax=candidate division CSSED10-310 bacterium TaxID=2855610 RepID=A0ABV6Z3V9_UNCC1
MFIGRVVGVVWATRKHPSLEGAKLLLVKSLDPQTGKTKGIPLMAVDKLVDAGIGDTVLVIDEGNSARQLLDDPNAPVRTLVIGVLDCVTIEGNHYQYH